MGIHLSALLLESAEIWNLENHHPLDVRKLLVIMLGILIPPTWGFLQPTTSTPQHVQAVTICLHSPSILYLMWIWKDRNSLCFLNYNWKFNFVFENLKNVCFGPSVKNIFGIGPKLLYICIYIIFIFLIYGVGTILVRF